MKPLQPTPLHIVVVVLVVFWWFVGRQLRVCTPAGRSGQSEWLPHRVGRGGDRVGFPSARRTSRGDCAEWPTGRVCEGPGGRGDGCRCTIRRARTGGQVADGLYDAQVELRVDQKNRAI